MIYLNSLIIKFIDFMNASMIINHKTISVVVSVSACISLILVIGFFIKIYLKNNKKNKSNMDENSLNKLIYYSGYKYDMKEDIFYNHDHAWQKDFGYCRLYDEAAASSGMIVDCEPIYFEYDNKRWMIEFWKGQYGLYTGCEVGIYYTNEPDINIPGVFEGPFYRCATDVKNIDISYSLLKDNKKLFSRNDNNWWVTGFKLGEFSRPSQLRMNINITMDSIVMRNVFFRGLKEAGYGDDEIVINKYSINILFDKTHTLQPLSRTKSVETIIQFSNLYMCDKYSQITEDYGNTLKKIKAFRKQSPEMFEYLISIGKPKQIFDNFKTLNIEQ